MVSDMKKSYVLFTLCVLFFSAQVFAVGFGGKLNSFHSFKNTAYGAFNFNESDKLNLWLAATLNKKYDVRLNTDVSYEFKYDIDSKEMYHVLDLNALKISLSAPFDGGHTLNFSAGRFVMGDATGIVFSQMSDGVFLGYTQKFLEMSVYVGSTSLVNTHDVKMILPKDTLFETRDNKFYTLGPTYMPIGFSVKFPELFAGQNLLFEFWHFRDFTKDDYQRYYFTAQLAGPIVPRFFYSALTTFSTNKFDSDLSNLSQLMFRFFPSGNSSVSASLIYASGANGSLKPFTSFTSFRSSDFLAEKEFSGVLAALVSGSIEFFSQLFLGLEVGVISVLPEKEVKFEGVLLNTNVMWNIFHDLKLNAGFVGYFADKKEMSKMKISLGLVFLF